jgi:hypothetical protein
MQIPQRGAGIRAEFVGQQPARILIGSQRVRLALTGTRPASAEHESFPQRVCDDGGIYRLDAATGIQYWYFHTGGYVRESPAVGGGVDA